MGWWPGGWARTPDGPHPGVTGQNHGVYLVDGSGLSYDDRVTASTFVSYLAKFPTTQAGRNFPNSASNGTGTLRQLEPVPRPGVVRAKTGTLGQVSTVVGYLAGRREPLLSLLYNGGVLRGRAPGAVGAVPVLGRTEW